MTSKLKATGIFEGILFIGVAFFNCATLMVDGSTFFEALSSFRNFLSLLLIGGIMFASAYIPILAWLQPIACFVATAVTLPGDVNSFYSVGFFVCGVLLLYKLDFFERKRVPKIAIIALYFVIVEVFAGLKSGLSLYYSFTPVIFTAAFVTFLFIAFKDRMVVYLKEPKAKLSLATKDLAEAESAYILDLIAGKSFKEIAFENSVSESTVRNTLARAYKKLGISGKTELAALAEKYEITE
jgi:Response regulator containing a CheY-like receiver domain and an HTH DNA-binding domain